MACKTIARYLEYSWIGTVLFADEKIAVCKDKNLDRFEIAYFSDNPSEYGPIRCAPFKKWSEAGNAIENAIADGACHVEHMRSIIAQLR